jgi:hypothetical protein
VAKNAHEKNIDVVKEDHLAMEYETINKFDRMLGGLQDGNALRTKPSTIQNIESITGSAETFTIQTVRAEYPEKVQNGWETKTVTDR